MNLVFNAICEVAQNRAADLKAINGNALIESLDHEKEVKNLISRSISNSIDPHGVG